MIALRDDAFFPGEEPLTDLAAGDLEAIYPKPSPRVIAKARPEIDAHAFRTAYAACAAQRHLRVVGQWVRLARRDNRPAYLAYGPLTWALLNDALHHPAASPLARRRWLC